MLEIFLIIALVKKVGRICRDKGRQAGWLQFLAVVFWIGGEIVGAAIGIDSDVTGKQLYLYALAGAAAGAGLSLLIAVGLEPAREAALLQHVVQTGPKAPLASQDDLQHFVGQVAYDANTQHYLGKLVSVKPEEKTCTIKTDLGGEIHKAVSDVYVLAS